MEYFRKLDDASDQLTLVEAGVTSEGRFWQFALISSAANLRKIDRLRDISRKLASPQDLTPKRPTAWRGKGSPSWISP